MKLLLAAVLGLSVATISASGQVSMTTSRNDNSRDGQNLNETILTPDNVNVNGFGKLFSHDVQGYVYAQPLYVPNVSIPGLGTHNVVYVATEHDIVYAFDADDNTGLNANPLWHASFIAPKKGITTVSSGDVSCGDLIPEIGITSTPVIDKESGTIYVVAKTKENGKFFQRLHALDITTGRERKGSPVEIKAQVKGNGEGSNHGVLSFDPLREAQRPGLLLQNGTIYIAWASHCDNQPYHGWVMSYNEKSLKQTGVWNSTPNGGLGGVWQSGTGIAGDDSYVYFATGNGTYDGKKGGNDFSDTVAKLGPAKDNQLPLVDWFTPFNQAYLSDGDIDVGSGGVLLLPDQKQGAPHEHLLIQVGKSGSIYLIDCTKLGHFRPKNNKQIVQDLENAIGGLWATPAWWNNNVYFGGSGDLLRQFSFDPSTGLLSTGAVYVSPTYFGFPGPTPSISADDDTGGIVWAIETDQYGSDGSSILHAYDATDVGSELYNTTQNSSRDDPGGAVKFSIPTVVNGRVYVGAAGRVTAYGLLGEKK